MPGFEPFVDAGREGDEPGAAGPGGPQCGSRARLWHPTRVEAWRANIHEPTRHEGASVQVKDPGANISRRNGR